MSLDEEVLVVEANLLDQLGSFSGFQTNVDGYLGALLDRTNQSFRPRREVETDPSFKQLIPYVILTYRSPEGIQIFQYTRGKGQGEQRLHAKRSIGIGGHISTDDITGSDWYRTGMQRELEEEIILEATGQERIAGLIYDDTSDVGRVHLGIVHLYELVAPGVRNREADLVESGFQSLNAIKSNLDRFETWSQLCINHLFV